MVLEAWPLTPNGKVDRRALPMPDGEAYGQRGYEAPLGEVESLLAGLWSELLQVERVGRHDNFFALGGHSLLAVRLMARIRQHFGSEVPLQTLFAWPVLHEFARHLLETPSSRALPPLVRVDRTLDMPLSFAQQRLWFLAKTGVEASAAYNMTSAFRIRGPLDETALQAALNRIAQRHGALRTQFHEVDGEPRQYVLPTCEIVLTRVVLNGHASGGEQRMTECLRTEASRPFSLTKAPLARAHLAQLGPDDRLFLLTMHHIVSDGWSMNIFFRELTALYRAYAEAEVSHDIDPLPPLTLDYIDYTVWQRRWLTDERKKKLIEEFKPCFEKRIRLLDLLGRYSPNEDPYSGTCLPIRINEEITTKIRGVAKSNGVTVYVAMLAAWVMTMFKLTGQDEILAASPVSNRSYAGTEPIIGFFVDIAFVSINIADTPTIAKLLQVVKEKTLEWHGVNIVPFNEIVKYFNPSRIGLETPLVSEIFNWVGFYENEPCHMFCLGGIDTVTIRDSSILKSHFDIEVTLREEENCISGHLIYRNCRFEPDAIQYLIVQFMRFVSAVSENPGIPLCNLFKNKQNLE
ncbi:hypothetical protein AL065_22900 [Pseudomonas amygdali pv. ulmi]|nr:hypothetical protein AL065_22900 [Pseudomonas amygdali pv. ulmi]